MASLGRGFLALIINTNEVGDDDDDDERLCLLEQIEGHRGYQQQ